MEPATTRPDDSTDAIEDTFISHARMEEYGQLGLATPLSRIITDFIKYGDRWWITDPHGWHLIDDQHLIIKLNNHATWADGGLYLGGH
jgi:hypothetical protein